MQHNGVTRFPDHPMFRGANRPLRIECAVFEAERAARRALFGAYRNPFTDDPPVAGIDRTTANTSVNKL